MNLSANAKVFSLFLSMLVVLVGGFLFILLHKQDFDNRVAFSLQNQHGQSVTERFYQGSYSLVFFGFTNCQHICPTGMAKLTLVMNELDDHGANVKPIFISVDPDRDNVNQVNLFLKSFHPKFDGLTGTEISLKKAADSFNTFFKKGEAEVDKNYDVTHSSIIYILDPYSRVIATVSSSEGVTSIVNKIKLVTS